MEPTIKTMVRDDYHQIWDESSHFVVLSSLINCSAITTTPGAKLDPFFRQEFNLHRYRGLVMRGDAGHLLDDEPQAAFVWVLHFRFEINVVDADTGGYFAEFVFVGSRRSDT